MTLGRRRCAPSDIYTIVHTQFILFIFLLFIYFILFIYLFIYYFFYFFIFIFLFIYLFFFFIFFFEFVTLIRASPCKNVSSAICGM